MAVARFKTSGLDVRLAVAQSLSPESRRQLIAAHAREGLRESQEINRAALGHVPPHDTFVDGRPGAPLDSVNPDRGVIVFRFQLAQDLLAWIEAMLILHSPVLTERYARSHILFADDRQADAAEPPEADVYIFLNAQPYARKIERGQSSQAPDGVYEAVAAMAARRFGNVARIRYGFRSFQDGALVTNAEVSALRRDLGRRGASEIVKRERETRQPAIIVAMN